MRCEGTWPLSVTIAAGGKDMGRTQRERKVAMAALPLFIDWSRAPTLDLAPGVKLHIFSTAQQMMVLVDLEPNALVPLHHHPHEQMGLWLEGEAAATIGDETRTLHAGDSYYMPGNTPHTFRAGPAGGKALDVFNPPREDYLARI
jgi:quercetin dioxygenase-like cupin family protein